MKGFKGFKRFDDDSSNNGRKTKRLSSKRRSKNCDQSVLPILNFEDSNGSSPLSEPSRWKVFDTRASVDKSVENDTWSQSIPTSFEKSNGAVDRKTSKREYLIERNNQRRKSEGKARILKRTSIIKESKIFDPFDLEERENQDDDFFTQMPSDFSHSYPAWNDVHSITKTPKYHANDAPWNVVHSMTKTPKYHASDASIEFPFVKPTTAIVQELTTTQHHTDKSVASCKIVGRQSTPLEIFDEPTWNDVHSMTKTPKYHASDNDVHSMTKTPKYYASDASIEFPFIKPTTAIVHEQSTTQHHADESAASCKIVGLLSTPLEIFDEVEAKTSCVNQVASQDVDSISVSSFPMRIKPIEFLKNRVVDKDDSYAGDRIFMKLHESYHERPNLTKESISESLIKEEDSIVLLTNVETVAVPLDTGIEIVDIETVASFNASLEEKESSAEGAQMAIDTLLVPEHPETAKQEDEEIREEAAAFYGKRDLVMSTKHQHETTPIEKPSSGVKASDIAETASSSSSTSEALPAVTTRASSSTSDAFHREESDKNDKDSLRKLADFTVTIPRPKSIRIATEDPRNFSGDTLGIHPSSNPPSEKVAVPVNVKLRRKKEDRLTVPECVDEESIRPNFQKMKARKPMDLMTSPSTGSLLDSVTEVSDFHSSSVSTATSINPRNHFHAVEVKSLESGSVSALSFQGKLLSTCSEDQENENHIQCTKPVPNIKIPRGPTKRKETDFASVDERIHNPRIREKKPCKPLGASTKEISMINKFLLAAGNEFDGSNMSIEQREKVHNRALKVGLTESFINKMLDQSAGILLWDYGSTVSDDQSDLAETDKRCTHKMNALCDSERTGHTLLTKDSTDDYTRITAESSYSEDFTLDERFIHNTPKEDNSFNCFKNIFWMESSNVVGDDMTENILAVVSADSESLYSRRRPTR